MQSLLYSLILILFGKEKEFVVESFHQFHLLKRTGERLTLLPQGRANHVYRSNEIMLFVCTFFLHICFAKLKILFYILYAYSVLKNFNDLHFVLWLGCPNRCLNGSHHFSNYFKITAVYSVFHQIFNTMFSNFITSNLTQF